MENSEHFKPHAWKATEQPEMVTQCSCSRKGSFCNWAKLQGKNCGAEMLMCHGGASDSQDCCINIYINNNIQGVNNATLVGSKVKMGDPGVTLTFGDFKVERRIFREHRRTRTRRRGSSWSLRVWSFGSILFVLLLIIFLSLR